ALETNANRSATPPQPVVSERKTPSQPAVNVAGPNLAKQSEAAPAATNTPPKLPWSVELNSVRPNLAVTPSAPAVTPQPGAAAPAPSNPPAPAAIVNVPSTNPPMAPPEPPAVLRPPEPRRK